MASRKKSVVLNSISTQISNQPGYYWGYAVTTNLSAAAVTLQDGNTISGVANVSAIAKDVNGTVTTLLPHGLSSNDVVTLTGVGGMVEILDTTRYTITVTTPTAFTIATNTSGFTAYTAGGTVNKVNLGVIFDYIPASTTAGTTKTLSSPIRLDAGFSTTATGTGTIVFLYD